MHAVTAEQYLSTFSRRFAALSPILAMVEREPHRAGLQAVLRDALMHLPYVPRLPADAAVALIAAGADRAQVVMTELGWLSKEMPTLRSKFQSAMFRQLRGTGAEAMDAAQYYLALVARMFRLEYAVLAVRDDAAAARVAV